MALLRGEGLSKSFGIETLFEKVNIEVNKSDKIALIGDNGSGKTTFFKILMGDVESDSGGVYSDCTIGYMEQHVCRDPEISSYAEVLSGFDRLLQLEQEIEYVTHQLNAIGDTDEERLHKLVQQQLDLQEEYISGGGLTFRGFTREVMKGLGFNEETMSLPVVKLSGGQKAKLQLCKLLLCKADILLLDEPTNHLDIMAIEWLEQFLIDYKGAFIVISHDRFFLDRVTSKTWELDNKSITCYNGNYTVFRKIKDERILSAQRRYDNTKAEIDRLYGIVEQQRRWNREKNIKTAESKLKQIDRLKETLEEVHINDEQIAFNFEPKKRGGDDVLEVKNLSLSFGEHTIFSDLNLELKRQDRVFLLGPNGCGKTSLLKTIINKYIPDRGRVVTGVGVTIGYYDQLQEGLTESKTVLDQVWDKHPKLSHTQVRTALARFLFTGDDVFKKVSTLSGGERARVLLLNLMLSGDNCLLLDEPTNHLDIKSCEALENALMSYDGTMLIVSHDRYLINKMANKIVLFTPSGLEEHLGNYDDYAALLKKREKQEKQSVKSEEKQEKKVSNENKAEQRRIRAELRRIENEIDRKETELSELEELISTPEIAGDYNALIEHTQKADAVRTALSEMMDEWEMLSEKVSGD